MSLEKLSVCQMVMKTVGPRLHTRRRPDELDGTNKLTTLPHPMHFVIRALLVFVAAAFVFSESVVASVIFKPGKKPEFVIPGEEEISGNAAELFQIAEAAEKEGNLKRAIKAYSSLVKRHPKDALAPGALYRKAQLQEQQHDYIRAAESFRQLVEGYPSSPHFDEAIEAQFRIGEMYLAGKKTRVLGIPFGSSMDNAVNIFAAVVRTAPNGKYTARAQFDIGLAREKQGATEAAIQAYQAVVDKFPNETVAADAQYQIGYIWLKAARSGAQDMAAINNARTAFQDFLVRYPTSEKAGQARANLELIERKQTTSSYEVAKFYDKQKYYRAAVIYYNEVIRQQPGSTQSDRAKKRIDQLRAKVGDAALQPALATAQTSKKKGGESGDRMAKRGPAAPGSVNDEAPLPSQDTDLSLPPPASLAPDTTTAPGPPPTPPGASAPSDVSSTPETSTSPEASASPAP
jgi:outer membrane protein assembly factor BamD